MATSKFANKSYLLVGGTSGIGKAVGKALVNEGARVTILGRTQPDDFKEVTFIKGDLTLARDAKRLGQNVDVSTVDAILFTNGITGPPQRKASAEGIEIDMAVSTLSRYAFMDGVLSKVGLQRLGAGRVEKAQKPRVFVWGYPGDNVTATVGDLNAEKKYVAADCHMNTVVVNEVFVSYLADQDPGINVYGVKPGLVNTGLQTKYAGMYMGDFLANMIVGTLSYFFIPTPDQYAVDSVLPILASSDLEDKNKSLWTASKVSVPPNQWLEKEGNRQKVLQESLGLLKRAYEAKI
ncbi:putative oxidoreductase [Chytriomyces sp. MP71]|nr:putative oxidoreductase [Chytriomyces sp. MP71]